jgi:N-acetylmuramoyl-L-alanine amidase
MGSRYLTDLADVVRGTGLVMQEEGGWQSRARGSGGYNSGLPNHVMVHHTASGPGSDGQPDVDYMCYRADARPIANLYLSRSGKVWVMAAGATNTNGSGSAPWGGCPNDSMNSHAIGIEAGNNGTGEPWPKAQQDAYLILVGALTSHYGIDGGHVRGHVEWAPGRKIDPAGPSQWASSGTWNMDGFRHSCGGMEPSPGPSPGPSPLEVEDMAVAICAPDDPTRMIFAWNGVNINWITSDAQLAVGRITGVLTFDSAGNPLGNFDKAAIQDLIDRGWGGTSTGQFPPGYTRPG